MLERSIQLGFVGSKNISRSVFFLYVWEIVTMNNVVTGISKLPASMLRYVDADKMQLQISVTTMITPFVKHIPKN